MADNSGPAQLLQKIYQIITAANGGANDIYLAFANPGVPLATDDLDFSDDFNNDKKRMWAYLADSIPSAKGDVTSLTQKSGAWSATGKQVQDVYAEVLNAVPSDVKPDPGQLDREASAAAFLYKDPKTRQQFSDVYSGYKALSATYANLMAAKQNAQLTAQFSKDFAQVQSAMKTLATIDNRLNDVRNDLKTKGQQAKVEKAISDINSVWAGSPARTFTTLSNEFANSTLKSATYGDFHPVPFWPTDFFTNADSSDSWTTYLFSKQEESAYSKVSTAHIGGSSSSLFGALKTFGFNLGGGASADSSHSFVQVKSDSYSVSFDMVQLPLLRPWFQPQILTGAYWHWPSGVKHPPISLGQVPVPADSNAEMPVYPTSVLLARNVTITCETKELTDEIKNRSASGGLSLGWGPFNLGKVSTSASDKETSHHALVTDSGVTSKGMTLVGWLCEIVGRSPAN